MGFFRGCLHNSQSQESCGPLLVSSHAEKESLAAIFVRVLCERQRVFTGNYRTSHISQFLK